MWIYVLFLHSVLCGPDIDPSTLLARSGSWITGDQAVVMVLSTTHVPYLKNVIDVPLLPWDIHVNGSSRVGVVQWLTCFTEMSTALAVIQNCPHCCDIKQDCVESSEAWSQDQR